MNERVMQFRIGMFVIVAGLVLTMLIVWFGESPTLFRDNSYVTVHFIEAPGIDVGIPVRKSGIRIGEVAQLKFDDREPGAQGVLVTLAIEKQYEVADGTVPRLSRALIGDVSIDMLPGGPPGPISLSATPNESLAPELIIEGSISPDPANALAAATKAFERAGATLDAIEQAATGVAKLSDSAGSVQEFLATWDATGKKIGGLTDEVTTLVGANRQEIEPTILNLRQTITKVNTLLDEQTQKNVKTAVTNLASGSARLDQILEQVQPVAADLGAPYGTTSTTTLGQTLIRANRIAYEVGLLTAALTDSTGKKLNANGTLQRLILQADLYENMNRLSGLFKDVLDSTRPMVRNLTTFSEKIARDPSALGRGVLER